MRPIVSFVSPDCGLDTILDADEGSHNVLSLSTPDIMLPGDSQHEYSAENAHVSMFAENNKETSWNDIQHASGTPDFPQTDHSPHSHHHANVFMGSSVGTPAQIIVQAHSSHHVSPNLISASPAAYSLHGRWPFTNAREAGLFHHYIMHLAPWIDVCDKHSHFGREVPKRAAHYPVLANAIFAQSSRHLNLLSGSEDSESPQYVSKCLQILIANLEDPLGHWDENFLAAVIILRSHEEMSDVDERCHLFGTTKLLNSISSFAADGGLREAASWASLRQHIYISLTSQHPVAINLTTYRHSSVFNESDDESTANRIVFIFASILTATFQPESQLSAARWNELDAEVQSWNLSKPWNFTPLWFENSTDVNQDLAQNQKPWPEVLMSHPAQVVGMQYYCLSKILLSIYDPRLPKIGFDSHRLKKASHALVLENMRMVIGLAVSNRDVVNAMFQACHLLSTCGSHFDNRKEQDAAEDFLVQMELQMGWRTSHIIRDLREEWQS